MKEYKTEMDKSISYLVVTIGSEKYAIHVSNVVNILEMVNITNIPLAPDYMKGIINVRGTALPVVDTGIKFGIGETEITPQTCIIIMSVNIDNEEFSVGGLVDSVDSVVEIPNDQIAPPPSIGNSYRSTFLTGVTRVEDEFVMILDFVKLFSFQELESIIQINEENKETTE